MFAPPRTWQAPAVSSLPSWKGAKRIAIDVETRDPYMETVGSGMLRGGEIVGVAFAIEDGPAYYLPVGHRGGGNLDREHVVAYLREQARVWEGDYVGANVGYDVGYLDSAGVRLRPRRYFDVLVAAPLIDERHQSYSLASVLERAGRPPKEDRLLRDACDAYRFKKDPRKNLWRLPAGYVGAYGEQDAAALHPLLRQQERDIDRQELTEAWALECRVLPALMAMHRRGVRVSVERLDAVDRWALSEEQLALDDLRAASGVTLSADDVWNAGAVERVFRAMGVELPKTKQGKPSVTRGWLASQKSAAAKALNRARKFDKIRTTFVASVRDHLIGDRIHTWFNQMRRSRDDDDDDGGSQAGTISGRISSEHPNLQQQPKRDDEIAKRWRSIYLPDDELWASCDFSQQEPRMLVHYADMLGLPRAHEAARRYREDPKVDNHQMMADLAGIDRSSAKIIFLALCYGMGGGKLCRQLGLPTERIRSARTGEWVVVAGPQGAALIEKFDQMVPFVRELARRVEQRAKDVGSIRTIGGRLRRFFPDGRGGWQDTYKALNGLIQGGCADQTKLAMAVAHEAGHPLQLQVHDELDESVPSLRRAQELSDLMRDCMPLRVPSRVDVETGPSWGEAD
jgi:DNA polymerase I-like protein with 3'-5' exonuclease and polymerase domains